MGRFILQRVLTFIPILLIMSLVIFFIIQLPPGDYLTSYVAGLKEFCAKHHIALADASFYYGQLYRRGIPYSTLMVNNINHPNKLGMSLFADALMKLFE